MSSCRTSRTSTRRRARLLSRRLPRAGRRCSSSVAFMTCTSRRPTVPRPASATRRAPCTSRTGGTGRPEAWTCLRALPSSVSCGGNYRGLKRRRRRCKGRICLASSSPSPTLPGFRPASSWSSCCPECLAGHVSSTQRPPSPRPLRFLRSRRGTQRCRRRPPSGVCAATSGSTGSRWKTQASSSPSSTRSQRAPTRPSSFGSVCRTP
mmetsp:Transcript_5730/g.11259  ORF Transcript_5730/g.11259 Transcript_5730/m.11259 type:complete len:207 (+) Transcript_5730:348-968(+)